MAVDLRGDRLDPLAMRDEEMDRQTWVRRTVRERPRPFCPIGALEDRQIALLCRDVRRLRGTGEVTALSELVRAISEKATVMGVVGWAPRWRR